MTEWVGSADITAVLAVPGATTVFDQSITQAALLSGGLTPSTIVRVRGELYTQSDQVAAAERPFGATGFAVVSEQAGVAGVASLPAPITDESSDLWFVWFPWQAAAIQTSSSLFDQPMYRFEFDS